MSELDQTVYVIRDNHIAETAIRDLDGYIDETTTPHGVAPRYHVRGTELWSWGVGGNNPYMVRRFDTAHEAEEALEETFFDDFLNAENLPYLWVWDLKTAENILSDRDI